MIKNLFHRSGLAISLLALCLGSLEAQQTSVAEAAAKARSKSAVGSAAMGSIVAGDYRNDLLGFEIRHLPGWTSMNRGTMNVNEAIGRSAINRPAGITGSSTRVFGMHDEAGSSVVLSITAIPEGETVDASRLRSAQRQSADALPNVRVTDEKLLLDDSSHHFTATRVAWNVEEKQLIQSAQALVLDHHAIVLIITAPSQQKLQSVIKELRSCLRWIPSQSAN